MKLIPWDDAIRIGWETPSSWGASDPLGYEIDLLTSDVDEIAGIAQTTEFTREWIQRQILFNEPQVYNGQNVQIRIRAVSGTADYSITRESSWIYSNKVTVGYPSISDLRIIPRDNQLDLTWHRLLPRTDKVRLENTSPEEFEENNKKYEYTGYDIHYTTSGTVSSGAEVGSNINTGWIDAEYSGTAPPASISNLNSGTRYRVRVRAKNGWGTGEWIEGSAIVPGAPKVRFSQHSLWISETDTDDPPRVKVILNQTPTEDITVNLSATAEACSSSITATEGPDADYTLSAKSFTFERGTKSLERTLTITPIEDETTEGDEIGCVSMEQAASGASFTTDPEGLEIVFKDSSQGDDTPVLRFYGEPIERRGEGSRLYGVLALNRPREEDIAVTITIRAGTATAGKDYTVLEEFLTGTIEAGASLYDRTTLDPEGRNLLTLVNDEKYERQETIFMEARARIDGEKVVAKKTIIIVDADGVDLRNVRTTEVNGKPALEFSGHLQSAFHYASGGRPPARYDFAGYNVLFQIKESGQSWSTPHDYNWQVPNTFAGEAAPSNNRTAYNCYCPLSPAGIIGKVWDLKPGTTYDIRAYTAHVPKRWAGGSYDRSNEKGKEVYGAAGVGFSEVVSITLGSIPSPPLMNNFEVRSGEIHISWVEPKIIGTERLTGYELQWKKSSSSNWNTVPISASSTSYTITQTESVEYEARVKATNSVGDSDWSEIRRAVGNPSPSRQVAEQPAEEEPESNEGDTPPPPPPGKISATFENVPSEHDGTQFTVDLKFGDDIPAANGPGYDSFDVINGRLTNFYRRSSRLYRLFILPNHLGQDVKILKHEGTCAAGGVGVCNAEGTISARAGYITIYSMKVAPVISRNGGMNHEEAHAAAQEGSPVEFTITLSRSVATSVTFHYETRPAPPPYYKAFRSSSCSTPAGWDRNPDLINKSGSITFQPGDASKTISITTCPADSIDEPDRYFTLEFKGSTFDGVRTGLGKIYNDGSLQSAWLSRLGRTVGTQITDAVTRRFTATPHIHIAGLDLGFLQPQSQSLAHPQPFNRRHWSERPQERGPQFTDGYRPSPGDLLLGSSFHHTLEDYAAWANFQQSHFTGSEIHNGNTLHLDGTVRTGVFGADVTLGRLLAGAALAYTDARGTFNARADSGALTSRLTTLAPYGRVRLSERLSAFGLLGYGVGDTTIEQTITGSDTHATVTLDHTTHLGAAGIRGTLPTLAGLGLALNADTLYTATDAPAAAGSAATHASTVRVRFALEAGRAFIQPRYSIHPTLELAARYDAGDAETGAGLEVAADVRFTHDSGVGLDASARQLLTHADAHEDRGISLALTYTPLADQLGWNAALTTSLGNTASTARQLWRAHSVNDLTSYGVDSAASVEAVLGYGFPAFRNRVMATPRLTVRDSAFARETQLGWRFTPYNPAQTRKAHFEVNFDTTRTVSPAGLSYGAMFQTVVRW